MAPQAARPLTQELMNGICFPRDANGRLCTSSQARPDYLVNSDSSGNMRPLRPSIHMGSLTLGIWVVRPRGSHAP